MADFDVDGARKAGYSEAEIVDHLAQTRKFDAAAARRSGYNDAELLSHLRAPLAAAAPVADPNAPSALGVAARGVVRGATMGFNDEMKGAVAGIGGLFTGEGMGPAYERGRDAARAQDAADQAAQPAANIAGQVYGGVGSALMAAPAAAATGLTALGARAAAPIAARLNPLLSQVPQWLGTTGRVVGSGAAGGAAAGFGEGQGGAGARLENAAEGGAIGAAAGGVLGAGVHLGGAVAGRLGHVFNMRNADVAADRQVIRSIERGGIRAPDANGVPRADLDEVERRLLANGDAPTALVDAGSRNTVNLGATAANTPSAAMDAADSFVQGRRYSRPDRLNNAGDAAFGGGSGGDVAGATASLRAQRTAEAGPLYDRAFNIELQPDEFARVAPFIADPIGQDAMARGLRVIEIEKLARGETFDPAAYGVTRGEGGKLVPVDGATPNMRLMDAVKRGYDEIVEGFRDPTSGRLNLSQYGRAVNDARAAYRGELTDMFHPYRRALEAWAGPSAQMEATAAGRTAFRTDRDVVAQRMGGPADTQEAYRLGAGRDFSDRVSDPQAAPGFVRDLLEDRSQQGRLNALLPQPQRDGLNNVLQRENNMVAVERAVSPRAGSQTARLAAGGDDMGRDPAGPWLSALSQLTSGRPVAAAGTVLQDQWRRFGQGINPATADALANRLFATDPAARAQVIQTLRNRLMQDRQTQERARVVGGRLLQGIGAGTGLTAD